MTVNSQSSINTEVFKSFPELQTSRLFLREIKAEDAESIFQMRSNERINQFIARPTMMDSKSAYELVEKCKKAFEDKQGIAWAGTLKKSGVFIGSCGFNRIDHTNQRAEIGGELMVEKWGQYFAFEAVVAILNFGIRKLNLHSVEAKVDVNNRSAIFLMESIGFKKEAHFREAMYFNDEYKDLAVYGLLCKEFKLK